MWKNKRKKILFFGAVLTVILMISSYTSANIMQSTLASSIENKKENEKLEKNQCSLCAENDHKIKDLFEQSYDNPGILPSPGACAIACGLIFIICLLLTGCNLVKCNEAGALCVASCIS